MGDPRSVTDDAKRLIERFATIVWESASDGLIETDSPSWRAFTGQSYDDWKGYGWLTALHPDDRLAIVNVWQTTVRDQQSAQAEYRLKRQDGQYRCMRIHAVPARDENGQIRKWFGIIMELEPHINPAAARPESNNLASASR